MVDGCDTVQGIGDHSVGIVIRSQLFRERREERGAGTGPPTWDKPAYNGIGRHALNGVRSMTHVPDKDSSWKPLASVPMPLETPQFVMEPLDAMHAELDFAALMSCRARLREELQWGDWPTEDFTLEANRADLERHHAEFIRGEAFAYTVLRHDRTRCLGCVYLEPCPEIEGAQLAFWVIDDAIDLEEVLLSDVLRWVHEDWCIPRVLVPIRDANARCIAFAQRCAWKEKLDVQNSSLSDYRCFLSESNLMKPGAS